VEGLFIFPVSDWDVGLTKACEASYAGIGVPTVTLGQPVQGRMDRVYPDEAGMARLLARHLAANGHRRCLFLLSDQGINTTVNQRLRAFSRAFSGPQHKVLPVDFDSPRWQENCVGEIKKSRFTAVIGASHLHAAWFYRAAREHGLRIPRDVSVAAFDDGVMSELLHPELTCTRIDHVAGAERAADILLARLESRHAPAPPCRFKIPGKLVVRQSVAEPVR
jgi:LacI family transcriptional regulator